MQRGGHARADRERLVRHGLVSVERLAQALRAVVELLQVLDRQNRCHALALQHGLVAIVPALGLHDARLARGVVEARQERQRAEIGRRMRAHRAAGKVLHVLDAAVTGAGGNDEHEILRQLHQRNVVQALRTPAVEGRAVEHDVVLAERHVLAVGQPVVRVLVNDLLAGHLGQQGHDGLVGCHLLGVRAARRGTEYQRVRFGAGFDLVTFIGRDRPAGAGLAGRCERRLGHGACGRIGGAGHRRQGRDQRGAHKGEGESYRSLHFCLRAQGPVDVWLLLADAAPVWVPRLSCPPADILNLASRRAAALRVPASYR